MKKVAVIMGSDSDLPVVEKGITGQQNGRKVLSTMYQKRL